MQEKLENSLLPCAFIMPCALIDIRGFYYTVHLLGPVRVVKSPVLYIA